MGTTTSIYSSGVCSSAEGWPGSAGPLCFEQGIQPGWAAASLWLGFCLVCSVCNLSGAQAEGAETTRRKLFLTVHSRSASCQTDDRIPLQSPARVELARLQGRHVA